MTQVLIFAELRNVNKTRIYLDRLRKVIPLTLAGTADNLIKEARTWAQYYIKTAIPPNRRTAGGLVDSFEISMTKRPNGHSFRMTNTQPYAAFIDLNDITATRHSSRKISFKNLLADSSLTRWFENSSQFYAVHGRYPRGTTIGAPGGSFHSHSLFSKYPHGLHFMDRSFQEVVKRVDDAKQEIIKKIKRI